MKAAQHEKIKYKFPNCWFWTNVFVIQMGSLTTRGSLLCSLNVKFPPVHLKLIKFTQIQRMLDVSEAHLCYTKYTCKSSSIFPIFQFLQKHYFPHVWDKHRKTTKHLLWAENPMNTIWWEWVPVMMMITMKEMVNVNCPQPQNYGQSFFICRIEMFCC